MAIILLPMSKHWRSPDSGGKWLSPDSYDALTLEEKRQLWRDRQAAGRKQRSSSSRSAVNPRFKPKRPNGAMGLGPWLAAAIAVGLGIGAIGMTTPSALGSSSAPVTGSFGFCHVGGGTNCVVDGDTFYIGGDKVRIAGVDAPETHDYRCASELALGRQATEKLQAMLNSGAVTMTSIDRDRDRYGRLLRNVAVEGQDVGEASGPHADMPPACRTGRSAPASRGNMGVEEGGGAK